MSNKKIVFKTVEGRVAVIHPSNEALSKYTVRQIADKDVPPGLPYRIVEASEVPSDRTFRDAWEIDDAYLTDGVGNNSNQFEGA